MNEERPGMRPALSTPAGRRTGLRLVVALASAFVLLASGIGWNIFRDLTGGISTTDVITGRLGGFGKPPGTDQNVLLVGVDSRTDAKGRPLSKKILAELRSGAEDGVLNSDTIILIHVPADGTRAVGVSIPRDSYVNIPGEGMNKINAAYPTVKLETAAKLRAGGVDPDMVDSESATAGRTALIKTVERLTGATIDHYAEVNLLGFYNLTNAIGGVEVCLNESVNEALSGARFPAGRQTISGGAALAFVRQRHELTHGDFDRIRRQQVFLAAVARKILSAGTLANPAKLQSLVDVAKEAVVLDTGWDVLAFARQASDLAGGRIQFMTIPVAGADTNSHGDVVLVDPDEVRAFVAEKTGSPSAEQSGSPSTTPSEAPPVDAVSPASLTVEVRNGTGRNGLAAQVARELRGRGYRQGKQKNAEVVSHSSVHYPPGEADGADQLARLLGGIGTEMDTGVSAGQVRVYLGRDFSLSDISVDDRTSSPRTRSSSSSSSSSSSASTPPTPPITADGVPCVD
ncbi:MAG: LCP family protein [Pseudonocardia sp.]